MPETSDVKVPAKAPVRTLQCPSLPPEIWIRILTFNTDLTHLWTRCRHVSHSFRAYTEYVFSNRVIRDTYIDFHLEKYNLGGKGKRPEIPTSFSHFEKKKDEKHVVHFTDKRTKSQIVSGMKKEYVKIMDRWRSNVTTRKPQLPNYTIHIDNSSSSSSSNHTPLVNDTALPDLTIDIQRRSVSFDWREMYTLFFREQALFAHLKHNWDTTTSALLQTNNARIARGEKLRIADYPQPWTAASVELRKQIRRKRLLSHYADNAEMAWAVQSLAHFENHNKGVPTMMVKLNPDLPGAGIGERWFGSVSVVQELYLDEWSSLHRIDTKVEHVKGG
ncbi:hypothetical protein DM02DRAFT_694939 [Periconia macrospinosa]|uniref:F-box domain-containing protein n=1 Tax=Periconia macrospinosa TaxID=97972 RepID=A0A2V1D8C9_9PLEO|nr:hypothetical protein DM02DRAFT_694939 [Periconia macrospinosa]